MTMVGQPPMVLALLGRLAAPGALAEKTLLMTGGPLGPMPFVLALDYGVRINRIAMALIVITLVSIVSLPAASFSAV